MARVTVQRAVWALVGFQHGVITRAQLLAFGFSDEAIDHRVRRGRLHPIYRGVYAVGRPELSQAGKWFAAVLACGPGAVLSHGSGAQLLRIGSQRGVIEVSVPVETYPRQPQLRVHRRKDLGPIGRYNRIPVMAPAGVLTDLATYLPIDPLEAAVNAADREDLIDPEALRQALDDMPRRPGKAILRQAIDRHTFVFTDSTLERYYLPLSDQAGLPRPQTQRYVNSYKVDFIYWQLGMVVETNGLRYHRTPAQQNKDLERSQAHTANGLTPLTFSHSQIRYRPGYVLDILTRTAARLAAVA